MLHVKLVALVAYKLTVEALVNHFTGLEEITINLDSYSNLMYTFIYTHHPGINTYVFKLFTVKKLLKRVPLDSEARQYNYMYRL